jgi:hypothetical protein
MTKLESLVKCYEMWDWLAEHPEAYKTDYPKVCDPAYSQCDCAACTYAYGLPGNCKDCPLKDYAWEIWCGEPGSPFAEWSNGNDKAINAWTIANACLSAIRDCEITREDALRLCAELWDWVAGGANRPKWKWPGWAIYQGYLNYCPCCEYTKDMSTCAERCPLYHLWPHEENGPHQPCEVSGPYCDWCSTYDPAAAKAIADAARAALAKEES